MKKILVIDDNTDIRENTAEILTLGGYFVLTAENGKKGVAAALADVPDLIVCDIMMPELDGYGVLHLLKKNASTENIPFIFLTAKTERTDFRKGMELGADDYITKPFDDLELLRAIEMRFRKTAVLQGAYPATDSGANELLRDLKGSGMISLDPSLYETQVLPKKMLLYTEGKRPRYLYWLKSGKVKTYMTHPDGKEYITNLYAPGDFIGYLAILEDKNYDDLAEVLEEAEVHLIPKEIFLNAVFNDMNIATKFIRLISKDVKEKENRLLHLAYDSLRKRVAKALLAIHAKFLAELPGDSSTKPLDIPREDIAQYVGTATESLIRTLSDFKSEKLISISEGKITIVDAKKLQGLLY
jgi:DNA-binding response OmpR family regulator